LIVKFEIMKNILSFIAIFISLNFCFSQSVPQGFNYQAVARDGSNEVITNKEIKVEIAIISENIIVYREVHDATTSLTGVFNVIIGQGATTDVFSSLNWGERNYRIRTRIDFNDGMGWQLAGESALLTVPYAMYALEAANAGEPGPPNILTIGSVVSGQTASATITGTSPQQTLNLVIPKGEKGDMGEPGPSNVLSVGSVTSGQTAGATITGTSPQQTLNLILPKGDEGERGLKGDTGDPGPANVLNIGTVVGGQTAGATITGTSPQQTLNLILPKGDKGDQGERGLKGDTGDPGPANSLAIGTVVSGQTASATITGNPPQQILNFVLPKGDKGNTGEQGPEGVPGPEGPQGPPGEGSTAFGETGYISRFLDSASIGNSGIFQDTNGNIGIKTTSPLYPLDVRGAIRANNVSELNSVNGFGTMTTFGPNGNPNVRLSALASNNNFGSFEILNNTGNSRILGTINQDDVGFIRTLDFNGQNNVYIGPKNTIPAHGAVEVSDYQGFTRAEMYADFGGNGVFRLYDINNVERASIFIDNQNRATVSAQIKNFYMLDPEDQSKSIWYASLEGPEAGAYERGVAELLNGETYIAYSDHFRKVINPHTVTIILTPHSIDTYGLAVVEKRKEGFVVKELKQGKGNFKFDWEVKGVRQGYEDYKVVRTNDNHFSNK
jgi:hypothetical protein